MRTSLLAVIVGLLMAHTAIAQVSVNPVPAVSAVVAPEAARNVSGAINQAVNPPLSDGKAVTSPADQHNQAPAKTTKSDEEKK